MKLATVLSLLAVAGAAAATVQELPSAVSKAVQLLGELKARIETDSKEEGAVFDKFACWCETTTQKKAASITAAQLALRSLGDSVLGLKGQVTTLLTEIQGLNQQVRENENSQKTATSIRQKQHEAFLAEEGELQQASAALESATKILKDATSAVSLRQQGAATSGRTWPSVLEEVRSALGSRSLLGKPGIKQQLSALDRASSRYSPQSATIQGILQDMYDTFTTDLESRIKEEAGAHRAYEDLMASLHSQLVLLQESLAKKQQEKAEAETMLAEATQGHSDTMAQLNADVAFFDATKASCVAKSDEWSMRKGLRNEELAGITQALQILTADSAKELFSKAIKPGFATLLQLASAPIQSHGEPSALARARETLQASAGKSRSIRLATLAAGLTTKLRDVGHFEDVIKAIDGLLQTLQEEGREDDRKHEDCKKQYHTISLATGDLEWKIEKNTARVQSLGQVIDAQILEQTGVVEELKSMNGTIEEMEKSRQTENSDFLQGKQDDLQAIQLLESAKNALAQFYGNHSIELGPLQGLRLLQGGNTTDQAPEAKFSDKASRKFESKGIIAILATIIEDLQGEIQASVQYEEAAQLDYEKRVAAARAAREALMAKEANLKESIALREQEVTAEKDLKVEKQVSLTSQQDTLKDLKPSCDWMATNLVERRKRRGIEADGLRAAKQYLAGMTVTATALVQRAAETKEYIADVKEHSLGMRMTVSRKMRPHVQQRRD
mmetsp:Transcript_134916/g.288647  ORF Transcript_134916/g.288647 Transcript_134916/m.288647 type:complete len:730 (-) Transcript_134916:135-2324(-)